MIITDWQTISISLRMKLRILNLGRKSALLFVILMQLMMQKANGSTAEAFLGSPVGVGHLRVTIDTAELVERWELGALSVHQPENRVIYSVIKPVGAVHDLEKQFRRARPPEADIYFLFHGDEPLTLTVPGAEQIWQLEPVNRPAQWLRAMREWRLRISAVPDEGRSYPNYCGTFLADAITRRCGLAEILPREGRNPARSSLGWKSLLDLDSAQRMAAFAEASSGTSSWNPADPARYEHLLSTQPTHEVQNTNTSEDEGIETAASFVPHDAYYIRFGKFSNLLWLLDLLEERAAELGRLTTLRSVEADLGNRIQEQLAVRELPFAEYLGDKLIADAVLVGHDFYFREGPAIGLLLKAKNPLLPTGIAQLRSQVAKESSAGLTTWEYRGQTISFLNTSDNRIRSFHASHDRWQFITNSKSMVERFVDLSNDGGATLAADSTFRYARALQPHDPDAIDIFLGPAFIARWASPAYRIEADRRSQAAAELLVAELADAARAYEAAHGGWPAGLDAEEGATAIELSQLAQSQLLPPAFAQRVDGSHPVRVDSRWLDGLRGANGSFVPVPDITIASCSETELRNARRVDHDLQPAFVRIRRSNSSDQAEDDPSRDTPESAPLRVAAKAYLFEKTRTGINWVNLVSGAATQQALQTDADLWLQFEAVLPGLRLANDEGNRHLLIGVLDKQTAPPTHQLAMQNIAALTLTAPVFRASWPGPGLIDGALPRRVPPQNIPYRSLLGKWRYQHDDIHLQSPHRDVLEQVAPSLRAGSTTAPAQVRFTVQDLETARLAGWLESIAQRRSLEMSVRNLRQVHQLMYRFEIPEDRATELAQWMFGGPFACPLGGNLESATWPGGQARLRNSAWEAGATFAMNPEVTTRPAVFRWFHGANGHVEFHSDRIEATVNLELTP